MTVFWVVLYQGSGQQTFLARSIWAIPQMWSWQAWTVTRQSQWSSDMMTSSVRRPVPSCRFVQLCLTAALGVFFVPFYCYLLILCVCSVLYYTPAVVVSGGYESTTWLWTAVPSWLICTGTVRQIPSLTFSPSMVSETVFSFPVFLRHTFFTFRNGVSSTRTLLQ